MDKKSNTTLLREYAKILEILKSRGVIRTSNTPVADYAEYLAKEVLNLQLMPNSYAGYDAIDKKTKFRYQVKSRRLTESNASRQLGVIRNVKDKKFDFLIGILFDKDFSVQEAYLIPHELIKKYGRYSEHQNGYILQLRGELLSNKKVQDITSKF